MSLKLMLQSTSGHAAEEINTVAHHLLPDGMLAAFVMVGDDGKFYAYNLEPQNRGAAEALRNVLESFRHVGIPSSKLGSRWGAPGQLVVGSALTLASFLYTHRDELFVHRNHWHYVSPGQKKSYEGPEYPEGSR